MQPPYTPSHGDAVLVDFMSQGQSRMPSLRESGPPPPLPPPRSLQDIASSSKSGPDVAWSWSNSQELTGARSPGTVNATVDVNLEDHPYLSRELQSQMPLPKPALDVNLVSRAHQISQHQEAMIRQQQSMTGQTPQMHNSPPRMTLLQMTLPQMTGMETSSHVEYDDSWQYSYDSDLSEFGAFLELEDLSDGEDPHDLVQRAMGFTATKLSMPSSFSDQSWKNSEKSSSREFPADATAPTSDLYDVNPSHGTNVKCNFCPKVVANKRFLSKHERIHTRPVSCPHCTHGTAETRDMKRHILVHHAGSGGIVMERNDHLIPHLKNHSTLSSNTRKVLRVLIKDREQLACPDSGSEQNIMSESFATQNGFDISKSTRDIKPFELGSGKKVWSIGRVRTAVELLGRTLRNKLRFFYVFASCPVPLIMGMSFLAEAKILTHNRHLLEACPPEFLNISSLLWIGSPKARRSPRNRMKCTLDGRHVMALADTASDLNFMCPMCAEREDFHVDKSPDALLSVQLADGTFADTIGHVFVLNLSLDWRKPITEKHPAASSQKPSITSAEQSTSFGTIFHVLPGLPCDVILGRDILDKTDAFNRCPDLSCVRTTGKKRAYELNIMILRRKKRKSGQTNPDPKEMHDNERHAEMRRRSKMEDEIALLTGNEQDQAQAEENHICRVWNDLHAACMYCNPQNAA